MLFHVEHTGQVWHYRWRITGPYPPAYLEWRTDGTRAARVIFQPEIAGCAIEAEWQADGSEEWSKATLHECAPGAALFRVKATDVFSAPNGFRVLAVLEHDLIACYRFPPLWLASGVETLVKGVADGPFADDVLLTAGDFRSYGGHLEVENISPSDGSFVDPVDPTACLSAAPGAASRCLFATARNVQINAENLKS
jgi:hypothetical protein